MTGPHQAADNVTTSPPPSRISATFARLRQERRVALMPYLTVGYPDLATTLAALPAMVNAGADMFELGIPFSDPLADGVTVQRASQRALENGVTVETVLEVARQVRERGVKAPLLAMGYYNPIFHYGIERFVAACAMAGIDGLIVPDLPPEECDELAAACQRHQRDLIMLLAPTSTDARIAEAVRRATGCIYCIALTGVTGARGDLATGLAPYLARVRARTDLPLVVGFGISKASHVAAVARLADGAVVASALLDRLAGLTDRSVEERATVAADFVRELRGPAA